MGNLEPLARTYPAGVTCWVDLITWDVAAASAFYQGLFGWELEDRLPPDGPERFLVATLDGLDVASISSPTDGEPPWATYVCVDDLEGTARRMFDLGATVVSAGEPVGPAGSSATMADPDGAHPSVEAGSAARCAAHHHPRSLELQRPPHTRPRPRRRVLRHVIRLGGRRPGVGDGDSGAGVRRPPGVDGRPRHPHSAGRCPRGLRGCDRRHGGDHRGRARALARDVHRR